MITEKKMQETITLLLFLGILISASSVTLGGMLYLIQSGHQLLSAEVLYSNRYSFNLLLLLKPIQLFSALGLIQLGLIILVITQTLRVLLLTFFYLAIKDYTFTLISFFIFSVLTYSMWQY